MRITDHVKIGGTNYQVSRCANPEKGSPNTDGQIIYGDGTIKLSNNENFCADYIEEVFLHEVVHGIFNHMGIEQNEEIITKLAKGLHMVVTDNPEIFRQEG